MSFVRRAQERSVAIFLLLLALAAAGVWAGTRLPSSIFPAVTFPLVKVIADVGEEPAARMIPAVTRPLEEAVARVPGIHSVRSITSRGSTEIERPVRLGLGHAGGVATGGGGGRARAARPAGRRCGWTSSG